MERSKDKRVVRLPSDMIIEILSRLSLKQLSQVQLVSKEWRALTQEHYLIQKHMARSPVVYHWHNEYDDPATNSTPSDHKKHTFQFMHGRDGLILIMNATLKKYYLWNPAIFRALELPSPHAYTFDQALFYIPSTRDYRIVSVYYKDKKRANGVGCEVLTPGPSMSWKPLPFPDVADPEKVLMIPTEGDVHFVFVTKDEEDGGVEMIVSLDVEAESFTVNHLDGVPDTAVLNWDGKLAFVNIVGKTLEVIKLEDYRKEKWGAEKTVIRLPFLNTPGFEGSSICPLFNRGGDIWFWLKGKEIYSYTIKTGQIVSVKRSKALFYETGLIYSYKQSLLSFEGMQPDTETDANLEKYRPPST